MNRLLDLAYDQQMAELQRLKEDLTLTEAPGAGAPPPVPMATRPGASQQPAPAGMRAKALYEYEVSLTYSWLNMSLTSQAAEDVRMRTFLLRNIATRHELTSERNFFRRRRVDHPD